MPTTMRNSDKLKCGPFEFRSCPMHRLDDLDVLIIKELGGPAWPQWNVRETYSSIAKRIGVDEETIRRRLKRAERLGSLAGWMMMFSPRLIGCEAASMDLEVEDEEKKDKAIGEIARADGVVKILNFRGRGLQVSLYYQNENEEALKRKTEIIGSICGTSELTVWRLGFPQPNVRMTVTDWKIVEVMLEEQGRASKAFRNRSAYPSARSGGD